MFNINPLVLVDNDDDLDLRQVGGPGSNSHPRSIVQYRRLTLVFIKPARGSLANVFLGQLLEPVVEQIAQGARNGRLRSRFVVERPGIRFFSEVQDGAEGHSKFQYEKGSSPTVSATAIYGEATYSSAFCSPDGLLETFEVDSEELDRMEGVVNRLVSSETSSSDSNAEEQTVPLVRQRVAQKRAKKRTQNFGLVNSENILPGSAKRTRAPTRSYLSEVRYNEVSGRESSVTSNRPSLHHDF